MSIDNHCGRDGQRNDFPASQAEAHSLIALEQAALYSAQLAIARWINSSSNAAQLLSTPEPTSSRAIWYAQAQQNFQEWLGHGGFAQYDIPCAEQFAPVMADFAKPALDSGTRPADSCVD